MNPTELLESQEPEQKTPLTMILIWAGVLALLAVVGLMLKRTHQGPIQVGDPVPDLSVTAFDGTTYRLSELHGKVVLINFWASWCTTCKDEAAPLEQAWRQLSPRGDVLFLGLDYVDTEPEAKAYLAKFDITYPNGPDLGTRWAQAFRIRGVPETYILDKEGRLAYIKIGPFAGLNEILNAITPLLEP
ncbi:MAG TPA: TlpA family protein disulfide reductase [Anaerolineae bacterium]|nr:TlpA family protein disulfide reductase [Anaerolineae bacterium]HID84003.1 TlpA family protein disulfide reductase [Anaerolineales bacterium]HIQ09848.1 TlpA family protein disulfide reductase [Anaerolineaceae bacterium]